MSDKKYVAVLDIGSNAVRLVVYDGLNRAPVKIHNERNVCSLGADLGTTGHLSPDGVKKALASIKRFSGLIEAMKIKDVRAVATAALRDAADGAAFIAKVKKDFGLSIEIIEGDEEAHLSAQGVMMNGMGHAMNGMAHDTGLIGDYGGGSLELIAVESGIVKDKISLPIGSHRLLALKGREARIRHIDEHLAKAAFLPKWRGSDFYALGGAWRSMARAHMHMVKHPLLVLDHYAIDRKKAVEFASLLSRQSPASLERAVGFSKKRMKDMAVAALVLERLFTFLSPARLVFSATGLREGMLYEQMPAAVRRQDPLIASCAKVALRISRFDDLLSFGTLTKWSAPLFAGADATVQKLHQASCLLSDFCWFEHEDYQAAHAFDRLLVLPYYGIDHWGRAFLALSQFIRYGGDVDDAQVTGACKILGDDGVRLATLSGLVQKTGYLLTGGALSLLKKSKLKVTPKKISLQLEQDLDADIIGDALEELSAAYNA